MKRAPYGACLAAAILVASGCRRVEETRSLNFDPETTGAALVSGWDGFEKTESGDTFVWADAKEARLAVTSRADGDRLVRFRCWPFGWPGAPPQTVSVLLNDRPVEVVTLAGEARVYAVSTPRAAWKRGANEIRFVFAYAVSPRGRVPGSSDERTLAAAFDWLEILASAKK